jgi:hypothetical protein
MKIKHPSPVSLFLYFLLVASIVVAVIFISQPILTHARTNQDITSQDPTVNPIPILAYYYIWYNTNSWNRAKTDTPLLGAYSSDDLAVSRKRKLPVSRDSLSAGKAQMYSTAAWNNWQTWPRRKISSWPSSIRD